MTRSVHVIINPAAGQPQPVLFILNNIFRRFSLHWEISITHRSGDAERIARQAARMGVDVVAVYGGDGTVMEAACGLIEARRLSEADGPGPRLAILPGGTANLLAVELGIPRDLTAAAELAADPYGFSRPLDVGRIERTEGLGRLPADPGGPPLELTPGALTPLPAVRRRHRSARGYFLLRVGVGFAARKVRLADRQLKNRYGLLAYSIAGLAALKHSPPAQYRLTLDGEVHEGMGLTCLVDNASNIGIASIGVGVASVSDGLLDVILVHDASFRAWLAMGARLAGSERQFDSFTHWQARSIRIEAEPSQPVQVDGEMAGRTPLSIETLPHALEVLTPG